MVAGRKLGVALTWLLLAGCGAAKGVGGKGGGVGGKGGGGAGTSSGPDPASANAQTSYYIATPASLPTCDAAHNTYLAYVVSEKQFYGCDGSSWSVITVTANGTGTGASTTTGTSSGTASATASNAIKASLYCTGNFTAQNGLNLSGLSMYYWSTTNASGDTWASAAISGASFQIGNSNFYAAAQNGAATAAVNFVYDVVAPADGGYWTISVNRNTSVASATYNDADVAGGAVTWTFPPCTVRNY